MKYTKSNRDVIIICSDIYLFVKVDAYLTTEEVPVMSLKLSFYPLTTVKKSLEDSASDYSIILCQ